MDILLVLLAVVIGGMLIFAILNSKEEHRNRDASETEDSWIDRKVAHYFRKLSLLEVVAMIIGGGVLIFVQVEFGVRLF